MTRDDAIKIFNTLLLFGKCDLRKEEAEECFKMAIKALEEQPSERTEEGTETHECDCISRKAVLDALHRYFADGFNSDKWWNSTYVLDAVNKVPSTTPQPKTGHWTHDGSYWKNRWICSECGYKLYDEQSKYCPNCGSYNGGTK
jgi:rubrerythrin